VEATHHRIELVHGQLGEFLPTGFWFQAAAWWRRLATWLAGWAGFALGGSLLTVLHALHVNEVCRSDPSDECFVWCNPRTISRVGDLLAQVPGALVLFVVLGAPVYLFVGLLVYLTGRPFLAAAPGP
jgi:hypothetical protein